MIYGGRWHVNQALKCLPEDVLRLPIRFQSDYLIVKPQKPIGQVFSCQAHGASTRSFIESNDARQNFQTAYSERLDWLEALHSLRRFDGMLSFAPSGVPLSALP
jgi:hypothetical protein